MSTSKKYHIEVGGGIAGIVTCYCLSQKDFLAGTSIAHEEKYLENYFNKLDPVFEKINKFETSQLNVSDFLEGPIIHDGFKRLN